MLLVDTKQGRINDDDELKESYANRQPYGEWLDHNLVNLSELKIPNQRVEEYTPEERAKTSSAQRLKSATANLNLLKPAALRLKKATLLLKSTRLTLPVLSLQP